jgi:hypothetical protein
VLVLRLLRSIPARFLITSKHLFSLAVVGGCICAETSIDVRNPGPFVPGSWPAGICPAVQFGISYVLTP